MLKHRVVLLIIVLFATLLKANANTNYWIKEGDKALAKQNIEQSIEYYSKAIKDNPKLVMPYIKRAKSYRLSGDFVKAARDMRTAKFLDPEFFKAYVEQNRY